MARPTDEAIKIKKCAARVKSIKAHFAGQAEITADLATAQEQQQVAMSDDDPDGHLCVVCMDNERSCLYVPCNHLAVCVECDADIMAASLPCPMCNATIDREVSVCGRVA